MTERLGYSPKETAQLFGISRARVYQLKKAGELPFYKDGRLTKFTRAGIDARIARLMSGSPSTGSLLAPEERKLARRRATEPLLPPEQPPPDPAAWVRE
jgi:excisionase family DNA binding protein